MKRKIYYVPGMLSLVMLPCMVFCWLLARETQHLYTMEVNVFREGQKDWDVEVKPPSRNYTTIELTGNDSTNQIKLAYATVILKEEKINKDTTNGIHFHFSDDCTYNDFVQVTI